MDQGDRELLSEVLARLDRLEREVARLRGAPPEAEEIVELEQPLELEFEVGEFRFEPVSAPEEPASASRPQKPSASLESAIGTRWLGRIGMLAIIFGVAFFLKYSFDNRLIGETGRVILGLLAGVAFLVVGEYFQHRRHWPLYGQILSGGGLAILYFALYAGYAFYHLMPAVLSFAALLAVTTTGILLSIRYSALALAVIGLLGGFLTPVILSTGENRPLSLFGYLLLLDLGLLTVVYFRRWRSLGVLSLLGTACLYFAWHGEHYTDPQQPLAFAVVAVFFAVYNGYLLLDGQRRDDSPALAPIELVFLSAAFFAGAVWLQEGCRASWTLKLFLPALATVEAGLAAMLQRRREGGEALPLSYAAASSALTVAATWALFEQRVLTVALAAEMAAFIAIGLRLRRFGLRLAGYLLGAVVLLRLWDEVELVLAPFERFLPIFNSRFLTGAAVIAAFYLTLFVVVRRREALRPDEDLLLPLLLVLTQLLSLALLSLECLDFFRFQHAFPQLNSVSARQLSLSVLWAVYAAVLVGVGMARRTRLVRLLGIGLLGLTVAKVFLLDLSELRTFYRIISFILLGVLLLGVSYAYNRFRHQLFGDES